MSYGKGPEGGPLKSRTKHTNGVRVPFFPSAHERQCKAFGFIDHHCVGQVERKLRLFAIEYSYIGRAAINSTITDRLKSHKDDNGQTKQGLDIVNVSGVSFACQLTPYVGGFPGKPGFLATQSLLPDLSQNCSEAADAPPHRCPWGHIERVQLLAREGSGALFLPRRLLCAKGTAGKTVSERPGGAQTVSRPAL